MVGGKLTFQMNSHIFIARTKQLMVHATNCTSYTKRQHQEPYIFLSSACQWLQNIDTEEFKYRSAVKNCDSSTGTLSEIRYC